MPKHFIITHKIFKSTFSSAKIYRHFLTRVYAVPIPLYVRVAPVRCLPAFAIEAFVIERFGASQRSSPNTYTSRCGVFTGDSPPSQVQGSSRPRQ